MCGRRARAALNFRIFLYVKKVVFMALTVGIDIGSTTVKLVVLDGEHILYTHYERHLSQVRQKAVELLREARDVLGGQAFTLAISGSGGLGVAKSCNIPFVQEVFATQKAVPLFGDGIDLVIELGGEDAKILFLTGGVEERMNGTCAGGTGSFIDQMATLLDVTPEELDALSLRSTQLYPIASRCGVFAKSDIQPLLNQNANHADIAASIFQAVVDQTITGLAQGRQLRGRIAFLGGPLFYFKGLQRRFIETLSLAPEDAIFPELGRFSVALGAALYAAEDGTQFTYDALLHTLTESVGDVCITHALEPLFTSREEYHAFAERHAKASVRHVPIGSYSGRAYLGIDCGSTTTKLVLIGEDAEVLFEYYSSNRGNPVDVVRGELLRLYALCEDRITIAASAVTGYGEELISAAFRLDTGLVETMAHFRATRFFCPDVDFILDIGGQDIKCFHIKNGAIDSIMLNEACSSGCGSFIETFARSMGYEIDEFSKLGLFAKHPVDLGSRCTVFMNSSVKQAQKEGADVSDISAGLSISVVKNAIYKVIRAQNAADLGKHIVVQGGTFYNDAVLRSFERELGHPVIRPAIAGLMGAYGAALYARDLGLERSDMMRASELSSFTHSAKSTTCGLCANKCHLTVNTFSGNRRFISGNRCQRPLGKDNAQELPNVYEWKRARIDALRGVPGKRGKIGIPRGLNMFENLPFWHAFLTALEFEVVLSEPSSMELYNRGRYSIPSDTACYPAKLMHGHIESLLDQGITTIFYPCLTYNFNEHTGDNFYNCPVVAYYPELLRANVERLKDATFLYPYFGLHRPHDFEKHAFAYFHARYPDVTRRDIRRAAKLGYAAYTRWEEELRAYSAQAIQTARAKKLPMIVLAGRPYHIDPEINHGIDRMIASFGIVILSEDSVAHLVTPQKVAVLNQWTYHARLYNAAKYCTQNDDTELVQLVSFGCGIDAITTDEVRAILERGGKFYTQLKIDEITNLGPARIRIRSLLGAVEERERKKRRAQNG